MAKLGEVLPMILAGIAGAASPRGAESMTGIANMMNQRSQQKLEEGRAQERLGMAREELGIRREQNARAVKLSDLAQEDREKKAAEEELEKQGTMRLAEVYGQQLVDKFGAEPAVLAQVELMKHPSNNKQTIKSLYESFTGERADEKEESEKLSLDDQAAIAQKYKAQGMTVRFGSNGEMQITATPEKPADDEGFVLENLTKAAEKEASKVEKAMAAFDQAQATSAKAVVEQRDSGISYPSGTNPSTIAAAAQRRALGKIREEQLGLWQQIIGSLERVPGESKQQVLAFMMRRFASELSGFDDPSYVEATQMLQGGQSAAPAAPAASDVDAGRAKAQAAFGAQPSPTPTRGQRR